MCNVAIIAHDVACRVSSNMVVDKLTVNNKTFLCLVVNAAKLHTHQAVILQYARICCLCRADKLSMFNQQAAELITACSCMEHSC